MSWSLAGSDSHAPVSRSVAQIHSPSSRASLATRSACTSLAWLRSASLAALSALLSDTRRACRVSAETHTASGVNCDRCCCNACCASAVRGDTLLELLLPLLAPLSEPSGVEASDQASSSPFSRGVSEISQELPFRDA